MTSHTLSADVIKKLIAEVEKVQRHLEILALLRFLDCTHDGSSFEECSGIYRLTPRPPPEVRRNLKAVLSKADYAALSKAWRPA